MVKLEIYCFVIWICLHSVFKKIVYNKKIVYPVPIYSTPQGLDYLLENV